MAESKAGRGLRPIGTMGAHGWAWSRLMGAVRRPMVAIIWTSIPYAMDAAQHSAPARADPGLARGRQRRIGSPPAVGMGVPSRRPTEKRRAPMLASQSAPPPRTAPPRPPSLPVQVSFLRRSPQPCIALTSTKPPLAPLVNLRLHRSFFPDRKTRSPDPRLQDFTSARHAGQQARNCAQVMSPSLPGSPKPRTFSAVL